MVELLMADEQLSFTDVEYGMRRRQTRRERFLDTMDCVVPWQEWVALIDPTTAAIVGYLPLDGFF